MATNKIEYEAKVKLRKGLESLVGKRFNKKTLEANLSKIFGHKAKVYHVGKDNLEATDYNYLTSFDIKASGLYGFVDIYFLKMRRKGFDGSKVYVTEINLDFE